MDLANETAIEAVRKILADERGEAIAGIDSTWDHIQRLILYKGKLGFTSGDEYIALDFLKRALRALGVRGDEDSVE